MQHCSYWFLVFSGMDGVSSSDLMTAVYHSEVSSSCLSRWNGGHISVLHVSKRQDIYKEKYLQKLFLRVTFCGSLLNVFYEFKGVIITHSFDILKTCLIEQQHWMYCRVYWMDFLESSCSLWTLLVEHADPLLTPPLSVPLIFLHLCFLVLFLSCQVHRGSKHKTHIIQTWQEQNLA